MADIKSLIDKFNIFRTKDSILNDVAKDNGQITIDIKQPFSDDIDSNNSLKTKLETNIKDKLFNTEINNVGSDIFDEKIKPFDKGYNVSNTPDTDTKIPIDTTPIKPDTPTIEKNTADATAIQQEKTQQPKITTPKPKPTQQGYKTITEQQNTKLTTDSLGNYMPIDFDTRNIKSYSGVGEQQIDEIFNRLDTPEKFDMFMQSVSDAYDQLKSANLNDKENIIFLPYSYDHENGNMNGIRLTFGGRQKEWAEKQLKVLETAINDKQNEEWLSNLELPQPETTMDKVTSNPWGKLLSFIQPPETPGMDPVNKEMMEEGQQKNRLNAIKWRLIDKINECKEVFDKYYGDKSQVGTALSQGNIAETVYNILLPKMKLAEDAEIALILKKSKENPKGLTPIENEIVNYSKMLFRALSVIDSKTTTGYKTTKSILNSLPFMADFFRANFVGGAIRSGIRGGTRTAMKLGGKSAAKEFAADVSKNIVSRAGKFAGDIGKAAVQTTLSPLTPQNMLEDYSQTIATDGQYTKNDLRRGVIEAFTENFSERMFGALKGILPKSNNAFVNSLFGNNPVIKSMQKHMNVGGMFEETAEEYAGAFLNTMFGFALGDEKLASSFKEQLDNSIPTILSIGITVGLPQAIGMGIDFREIRNTNKRFNVAEDNLKQYFNKENSYLDINRYSDALKSLYINLNNAKKEEDKAEIKGKIAELNKTAANLAMEKGDSNGFNLISEYSIAAQNSFYVTNKAMSELKDMSEEDRTKISDNAINKLKNDFTNNLNWSLISRAAAKNITDQNGKQHPTCFLYTDNGVTYVLNGQKDNMFSFVDVNGNTISKSADELRNNENLSVLHLNNLLSSFSNKELEDINSKFIDIAQYNAGYRYKVNDNGEIRYYTDNKDLIKSNTPYEQIDRDKIESDLVGSYDLVRIDNITNAVEDMANAFAEPAAEQTSTEQQTTEQQTSEQQPAQETIEQPAEQPIQEQPQEQTTQEPAQEQPIQEQTTEEQETTEQEPIQPIQQQIEPTQQEQPAQEDDSTALNGVPDIVDDTPQDARTRGFRRVNGYKIDRQKPLQAVNGKEIAVRFSNDVIANGHVAVIDAEQLQPSHIQGVRNPLHFIDEAQPKERNDEASIVSAQRIAKNIRPEEITSSVTAYTGAPIINARGETIQGNNRSDALRLMWSQNKDQAAKYKQYLIDHAQEFGLNAEDIAAMERPILVNMIDVSDEDAIALGQYVAQDTESGGLERIKPKNAVQKMGADMRTFANLLLSSNDDEISFAGLIDKNGVDVLNWLGQKGYITPTQYKSAFDTKGYITAEAKNDLRGIMYQSIFQGGSTRLEEMFNTMPAKAQKAILATAFRDYDSPKSESMIVEIQNSIRAYYALSQSADFMNAKTYKDVRLAVEGWKKQYQIDDATGESYLPAENFSNFALLLATMYKGEKQTLIQGTFNKLYDLIQGTQEADLFETPDNTPRTLSQAIKEVLNIDYNGQQRSNVLVGDTTTSQRGEQGSTRDAATRERTEDGKRTADNSGSIEAESRIAQNEKENTKSQSKKPNIRRIGREIGSSLSTEDFISETMSIVIKDVKTFPKEIRDEDIISKEQKSGKKRAGIKVKVGLLGNDLYIQYREGRSFANVDKELWEKVKRLYSGTIKIPNATNYSAGQLRYRLDYAGTTTDIARIVSDAVLELFHKKELRLHKGSDIGNVSIQEAALRDALIDKLREAGIDVITDVEEAQRVLDEANGKDIRQQKTTLDAVIEARDNEYLEAVRNGDLDKAQRMVVEAAKVKGYNSSSQYQGTSAFNGAAPWGNGYFLTKEERKEAWDNDEFDGDQTLGDYIHRGIDANNLDFIALDPRNYRAANPMRKEAIDNVRNAIQKKSETITMYRSVPSDVKEGSFRNGDWVTPSRAYAVENAKVHGWGDNFNIIEQKVPVDEIWWDGNDIAEWGYGREEDFVNDKDFAYKNTKNNRKLLDAVTYDDNGNVIPLSKRFNARKSDIRFFRTADGNAYGFTVGGKIYIDQRIATADTPIHEYAHLWASAMQKLNPNEWANIVKLMKGTPIWEEVKRNYPELTTDNEIADEVLAFYSGSRGAERLREEHAKILKGNGNVVEKVKAINAIKRVREALKRFWKNVADWFGIHFTTAEEVADKVLSDLLNSVNPTLAGIENDIRYRRASNRSVISSRFERQAEIQREEKNTKSAANIVLGNANVVLNDTNIFDEQYQNAIDNNLIDENVSPLIDSFGITWGYQLKNGVIVINKDVFVSDILDKRVKDNLSLLISSLMKTNKTFFKEGISFFKKLPIWVLYKNDTKSNEDTIKEIINDILLGNTSIDTNKLELLKQYTVQDMNDILDNATKWFEKFEGISSNMFAGNSISDILDTTLGDLMPKEITTTQEGKRLNWFSKLGIDIRSKLFDSLDWFRVVSDKTKDKTASELYDAMIVHTKRVQGRIDIFDKEYVRPIIDTIQSMLGKDFGNSTLSLDLIQEYFAIKSLLGRTASLYKERFGEYLANPDGKKPQMFDEFKQIYDEITEDEIKQRINEMGEKSSMPILKQVDIDYLMEEVRRTLAAEMFVKQYVYSSANTLNQGLQGEQSLGLINEVTNEPYSELYQLLYSDEQSSQTMHSPIEIIEQADILIDRAGLRKEFDFIGNQIQAILNYVNIERVENGLMSSDTFAKRQLMKDFVNQRGENSSEGNLYEITAKQKANEKMKGKDWFNPNSITSIIAVAQTEIATMEKELLAQRLSYFLTNPNNFDVLSQYGMIIDEKETLNEELSEDERNYITDKNIVLLYGERHTDKDTKGQVDKKKINILKRNDDGTFTKVTISFDNKFIGLEEFVKFVNNNFKYEELRGLSKAVTPITAWFSRMYTILSPLFPTKNLFKDLMVTPWLPAKELNGKNSQYAIKNFYNAFNNLSFILKMSFTEKSFSKKGFENKLKARSQELFEYYLEYSKQHSIFSIEDQIGALSKENKTLQDIEKALSGKENKFIKFTERALLIKFMQHYAEVFENLHKFSAYVTLRKLGYGEERSAQIANNATLNYDRSGSIGRQLNAIIPFAKAALGGLYRTNYLLPKYNPKGFLQRVITLAVLGVMQGLMYDPDDDDISEFARKSGMVFGSFLYPLLPEELSIVRPVRALVIVMAGKKSPAYFKQELMESTIDLVPIASDALRGAFSYNPLTNKPEFDVGQLFANTDKMTAFYALAMLASYINENKNSFGKNVLLNEETNTDKTRYGRTKQDYGLYDYIARLYNSILNGVDIDDRAAMSNKIGKNGERLMTIAKEDVEFVINNYIPFGRLYAYTAEIIYDAVNDKRINKGHIPLIGGLFAQKSFGKDYYLVNNIKYELKDFTNDFSQSQIEDIKTNILDKAGIREGIRYKALKDNNANPRMLDRAKRNMNDAFNVFILDINNLEKTDFTEDEQKFMLKSFLDSPIIKKALSIGEDTLNKNTAKRVERTYKRYKKYNNENIDTDKENMKDAVKNYKKELYDKSITEEEFNNKLNSLYEPLFQQIKLRAKFAGYSIE